MLFSDYFPDYFTATILEWKHLLKKDKYKDIIISSLLFLVKENGIKVCGFCIMSSHIIFYGRCNMAVIPKRSNYHL
jgi:hypothetical protein